MEDKTWMHKPGPCNFLYDFEENQYKRYKKEFEDYNWEVTDITYHINNLGYRSEHDYIQDTECNIAIGCSYTFGYGMPEDKIWPNILNKKLKTDLPMYNLGVNGASPEECYRVLKGFLDKVKAKTVYCLLPYIHRRSMFLNNRWKTVGIEEMKKYSSLFTREAEEFYASISKDAISHICHISGANLKMLYSGDYEYVFRQDRTARDLQHFGYKSHNFIADLFLKGIE
jgi:hypothetical protein